MESAYCAGLTAAEVEALPDDEFEPEMRRREQLLPKHQAAADAAQASMRAVQRRHQLEMGAAMGTCESKSLSFREAVLL